MVAGCGSTVQKEYFVMSIVVKNGGGRVIFVLNIRKNVQFRKCRTIMIKRVMRFWRHPCYFGKNSYFGKKPYLRIN